MKDQVEIKGYLNGVPWSEIHNIPARASFSIGLWEITLISLLAVDLWLGIGLLIYVLF